MEEEQVEKRTNKHPARRLKSVSLDKIGQQFLIVLGREATRLMDLSYDDGLGETDAKSLVAYLKLVKVLKQQEEDNLDNLTDEELAEIAKKEKS